MAAYTSPWPSQDINDALNQWLDSEAGALVGWALRAVESLHYLADVDAAVFTNLERPTMGHPEQAVDTGTFDGHVSPRSPLSTCARGPSGGSRRQRPEPRGLPMRLRPASVG